MQQNNLRMLIRQGYILRETDQVCAGGKCFAVSLSLALAAHAGGLEVKLLRWTVKNDSDYADHWAVQLPNGWILDATSAQFDRDASLLRRLHEYPDNFVDRCEFPVIKFIDIAAAGDSEPAERLPAAVMYRCLSIRIGYRFRQSVQPFNFYGLCGAVRETSVSLFYLTLQTTNRALQRRLEKLRTRLAGDSSKSP